MLVLKEKVKGLPDITNCLEVDVNVSAKLNSSPSHCQLHGGARGPPGMIHQTH